MKKTYIRDILGDVPVADIDVLLQAFDIAATQESSLEPTLVREIEPVRTWLRSRYYNSFSKNLYDYWEDEIVDFVEGGYNEWVVTGSIGTGKSSAALVTVQRKIYEMSCWDIPQRLFRLADMTKIFFAYLSVNLKQADLTGFGQIRSMFDGTSYFLDNFPRDSGINSILKFPKGIFMIPGSDAISVIGTNLFGTILDEANFLRKSGMSQIGDISKAQEIYAETSDRRRSRFMYKGKDPGFSILVSSSTVQTSFTSSRIENHDELTKVTNTKLWEVKPASYSDKTFFVFNGSDKDDPFIIQDPHDFDDLLVDPVERRRIHRSAEASLLTGDDLVSYIFPRLPEWLGNAISEVPVDFRASFDTNLYKALRNIAGVSIAPVGKLWSSRMLWNSAVSHGLSHPFTSETVTLSIKGSEKMAQFFKFDQFFDTDTRMLVRHPHAPRYLHVDQSKNTCRTGIACVHQAGTRVNPDIGTPMSILEVDFVIAIDPPRAPDKIAFYKIREFIIFLKRLGMKIGHISYDQYQSEDSLQLFQVQHIDASLVSVDRNDKPYMSVVNLLNEGRLHLYDYPILKQEFFNLDHDRGKCKVDHPGNNPDGSVGAKDVSDALAGAVFSCLFGDTNKYIDKRDAFSKIRTIHAPQGFEGEDFSWVLPERYRKSVKVEARTVSGDKWIHSETLRKF